MEVEFTVMLWIVPNTVVLRKVFGSKRVEVMGVDETTQGSP